MAYYLKSSVFGVCFISVIVALTSCQNKVNAPIPITEQPANDYVMYQPSEMAGVMQMLYAYNENLKQQILNGETPTAIPFSMLQLHKAKFTAGKSRTTTWNAKVEVFIKAQQSVLNSNLKTPVTQRYNAAINACIACHNTECVGPIPRIKKLLIQ